MKLREIPNIFWPKQPLHILDIETRYPYRSLGMGTIALSILVASIFFAFGSGLLIPAVIIGLIFSSSAMVVIAQYNLSESNIFIKNNLLLVLNYSKIKQQSFDFISAARRGDLTVIHELLNGTGLSITQKVALLNHKGGNDRGNHFTALEWASCNGHFEIVREILSRSGLALEHKMDLLNHKRGGFVALQLSAIHNHPEITHEILNMSGLSLEHKMLLLNSQPDYTPLILAASNGYFKVMREILNRSGLSIEHKMDLLNHKDSFGDTALSKCTHFSAFHTPFSNPLESAREILNRSGLSFYHKMILFNHKNKVGETPLIEAAKEGRLEIVNEILNSVSPEQIPSLLTYQNPINNQTVSAIVIAFENGYDYIVTLLQQYGAILPEHLRRVYHPGAANFNDRQSTHTATVHDSLARSAMACVARINNIPQKEKAILIKWAKGKAAETNDIVDQEAVLRVMQQRNIQTILNNLVSIHYKNIVTWASRLDNSNPKKAVIIRALNRIKSFTTHRESRTYLTLAQTLVLAWIGIKTNYKDKTKPFSQSELTDRLNRLAQYLWEIQRQYNLNDKGEDCNPNAADHPACPGGTFNNLVMPLTGADPDVNFIFVNEASVKSKAMTVLSQLFIPTEPEYTSEIIKEMNKAFLEDLTYKISPAAQNILRVKLLDILHKEFDEYVASKMLQANSIERAAEAALAKPNSDLVTAIEHKLTALKEIKAKSLESQKIDLIEPTTNTPSPIPLTFTSPAQNSEIHKEKIGLNTLEKARIK